MTNFTMWDDGLEYSAEAVEGLVSLVQERDQAAIAKAWEEERAARLLLAAQQGGEAVTLAQMVERLKKEASPDVDVAKIQQEIDVREATRKAELAKVAKFPPPPISGGSQ